MFIPMKNFKIKSNAVRMFSDALNFKNIYDLSTQTLVNGNISEPKASSRFILSHATGIGYRYSEFLRAIEENMQLSEDQLKIVDNSISKRLQKMPVQYIVGNWDFYGLNFKCVPPVLIPRPETEELVGYVISKGVLDNIFNGSKRTIRILDIGAGSGVIGLSLLNHYWKNNVTCTAIDLSNEAVQLSSSNANHLNLSSKYDVKLISFLDFVKSGDYKKSFDIIVSNPPYIPLIDANQIDVEVKDYEDHEALFGGNDGMDIIKDIILHSGDLLSKDGTNELWLEVDPSHPPMIEKLLQFQHNIKILETIKDLSGNYRFVRLKYVNPK